MSNLILNNQEGIEEEKLNQFDIERGKKNSLHIPKQLIKFDSLASRGRNVNDMHQHDNLRWQKTIPSTEAAYAPSGDNMAFQTTEFKTELNRLNRINSINRLNLENNQSNKNNGKNIIKSESLDYNNGQNQILLQPNNNFGKDNNINIDKPSILETPTFLKLKLSKQNGISEFKPMVPSKFKNAEYENNDFDQKISTNIENNMHNLQNQIQMPTVSNFDQNIIMTERKFANEVRIEDQNRIQSINSKEKQNNKEEISKSNSKGLLKDCC